MPTSPLQIVILVEGDMSTNMARDMGTNMERDMGIVSLERDMGISMERDTGINMERDPSINMERDTGINTGIRAAMGPSLGTARTRTNIKQVNITNASRSDFMELYIHTLLQSCIYSTRPVSIYHF